VKRRACGIALGLSLVWACPAFGADTVVHAVEPAGVPAWDTPTVNIQPGESVTWSFTDTTQAHNVEATGGNWSLFVPVALRPPDKTVTFADEGTFAFVCEVHPDTMKGVVTVTAVAAPPPPPPPPPPLSAQPFANDAPAVVAPETSVALDKAKPSLTAVSATRRAKGVARVKFKVSEESVTGIAFARGKKIVKSYAVSGHGGLYFDAKGLRAGRYTIAVVAVDLAGNKSRARTLRLTVR
jgi:plastocyanin